MDFDKCGAWFNPNYKCSLDKLKQAYETICATDLQALIASMHNDEQFYLNDITDAQFKESFHGRTDFFRDRLTNNFKIVCKLLQEYKGDKSIREDFEDETANYVEVEQEEGSDDL